MSNQTIEKKKVLNANDRCDRCGARALVLVQGDVGELMFCGHHYMKAIDNAVSYDKLMRFAKKIVDERSFNVD